MMFLRCLRFSYAGGVLQSVSGCWWDVWFRPDTRRTDGLRRCEGLEFLRSMEEYGYISHNVVSGDESTEP